MTSDGNARTVVDFCGDYDMAAGKARREAMDTCAPCRGVLAKAAGHRWSCLRDARELHLWLQI